MCTYRIFPCLKLITYNPPAQPDVVMLEQNRHKRILKVHLEALGTQVVFGSELRRFT